MTQNNYDDSQFWFLNYNPNQISSDKNYYTISNLSSPELILSTPVKVDGNIRTISFVQRTDSPNTDCFFVIDYI
ncbi:hypothetical protein SY86_21810 [Erwinia tracheiphila]|uniref:Uncharacterized protein n=1 Tax=Erwinia tracheiphila TaxID=65700 RepID=A0A0M2KEX3_9GAMM|nr:hypothetical protein ETR_06565 [Erwinia tracheiphila PSU-1]KKF37444.1 hypothetical protein SY86_21810 [Erwinia tracheiphila]